MDQVVPFRVWRVCLCDFWKATPSINMDDSEDDSSFESTGGSPEIKEKRSFPVPTAKGVFMFVGVVLVIAVLGMAGYIFYKAEEDDSAVFQGKEIVGSETTTTKKAKKPSSTRQKRRHTQTMGPQNAPLEAQPDEDGGDSAEKADDQGVADVQDTAAANDDKDMLNDNPSCTTSHNFYKCEGNEQPEMFLSHLCLSNSDSKTCFEWRPQRFCLTSPTNRFRSSKECEESCNENKNCGMAASCECSGMYRKANYVYDMRRQRCRLIPIHECVEVDVGFADNDECLSSCGSDTPREDARCKLAALEELVRPCMWEDKVYTHYYDARSGQCQPWDESVCSSNVFRRLADCFRDCPLGVIDSSSQPGNATGKVRRIARAQQVSQHPLV
ncbi:hypothetical protein HPB52_023832 [Rhipicephalus sanguineus]|uniref:Pancreatic trypsin inhibitor n=1 Tax=Rhipicephalus sanguineus TaxID=34632 RepID=A0A9D4PSQ2_RHISA|nr:hypothetical protein HPB52_023832 [Rhipicephalus sanguineus]